MPPSPLPPHATPIDCPPVPDIDRRITAAFRDLGAVRERFATSPSAETFRLCEAAQAAMDQLLDLRLSLTAASSLPASA